MRGFLPNLLVFSLSLVITSCANIKMKETKKEAKKLPLIDQVTIVELQNGKVQYQEFTFRKDDGAYTLACSNDSKLRFQVRNEMASLYFGASYFRPNTNYTCSFEGKKILDVKIKKYDYPSERLNVDKSKVVYSKKDLARIIKEKEIKKKIYLTSADQFLFDEPFRKPLNSYVTSHYGNQRIFNNLKRSQHLGNDLRARTGVNIPVANKGKVVFTGNLFFSGNVVVVDHGLGIFTMYGHLSKILTTKGSIVNKGDIIGKAGATGRVSGPHLHWGVKVNGAWVDGFNLVEVSQKQFKK
jgi:murein DD-endopeptidase MepM/ murein hydrolase activator NlpD